MKILQTPDSQFEQLPDYPFAPHYAELAPGLKMHYVDEGQSEEIVLLLHGEPSWSYLYRKMIPIITQAGYRAIAPDLIGFGRSSKPTEQSDYSYARHLDWLRSFIQQLDLRNVTLFCQDWGGLLGLRLLVEESDRFSRAIAANTYLPTGETPLPDAFNQWKTFSQQVEVFSAGGVLTMGTVHPLSPEVRAAYDAPFPTEEYKAGARIFPLLVPASPDDPESANNKKAWQQLIQWQKPFLTLFSDSDPIMNGREKVFQKRVPGAAGQAHHIISQAGHFLQEDKGEEIAQHIVSFMQATK
ncbi:MAG: haloalkane dehalogenase [Bacteroidota bacterium]